MRAGGAMGAREVMRAKEYAVVQRAYELARDGAARWRTCARGAARSLVCMGRLVRIGCAR